MTKQQRLVLVDGSSYLYRAFHVLESLSTSRGEPTGAMYGVLNMLRKLQNDFHPDCFAVVFDPKGKTFRDALYSEYKAQRPAMPDELRGQIEPLFDMIRALGLPLLIVDGYEADDVIATLAGKAGQLGFNVIISTGDKDLAQLVNDRITLVNTMNDTTMDRQGVRDKFGVEPEQIVDYLALVGDKSDNIPGIPGVGPKTAAKWLQQYHDVDNILAHAKDISGKVGENLRAHQDRLPLNRQLVTVKYDVPVDAGIETLRQGEVDNLTLLQMYQRWEFSSWLKELQESGADLRPKVARQYTIIDSDELLDQWLAKISRATLFAFDTETTSLNYMDAELVGMSFATQANEAAYLPLAHRYLDAPRQLDRNAVLEKIKPVLQDPRQAKVGHNMKYDMSVLARYAIEMQGIAHDTMLQSYCYNSTAGRHNMDDLALKYLGFQTIHYEQIAGKGSQQKTFDAVDVQTAGEYAAEDADVTLQLHEKLYPMLPERVCELYTTVEIPLVPVLSRIERHGVLVDADLLAAQSREISKRLAELETEAQQLAGEKFNLSSTKQLQQILFDKQKLPVRRKTPKGKPSTDEAVLKQLAEEYPLPKVIMEHRSILKLKSTYLDSLPKQINPQTGRIHTSYHQAVAATGRLSSADPNLQNIPIRNSEGRRVRKAFIAPPGYIMVSADYSQIELRIMAHLSKDETLCQAYVDGKDIHRATAAEVFGCTLEEVSSDQRRSAKAINFGLIYGQTPFGLANQLDIPQSEARRYINDYFDRYPSVKHYQETTKEQARQQGYVETLFGRRLYLPEIKTRNFQRRSNAERVAINAPMQGTAADIIKRAMIAVDGWLQSDTVDAKMIMQVHDELVFEVRADQLDRSIAAIEKYMAGAADLSIPLVVDIHSGANWDEAH